MPLPLLVILMGPPCTGKTSLGKRLAQLKTRTAFHVVQLRLKADGPTLLERFIRRESEDRHPSHQGMKHLEAVKTVLLRGEQEPLEVEGDLLTLDTTDFAAMPYEAARELVARRLR